MLRSLWNKALLISVGIGLALACQSAHSLVLPPETAATHVLLMDATTGEVLFERQADELLHPSSMTKILTVYLILKKIQEGKLKLEQEFPISENAYRTEGSRMFAEVNTFVRIEDLLRGAIVQSGNDACVALAEGVSGNERAFAEEMTRVAHELGATKTNFINSSGLPDDRHITTARDLARISLALIRDFPEYYKIFAEKDFRYNNITQGNRNPLLYKNIGADGVKTGHTERAGYGMVASALQGDRRLILVFNGLSSMNERSQVGETYLRWGFSEFDNILIAKAQQDIQAVPVANGNVESVNLRPQQDILLTVPRDIKPQVKANLKYKRPLIAPLVPEQEVAQLVLQVPGKEDHVIPLYPASVVEKASFFRRVKTAIRRLVLGETFEKDEKKPAEFEKGEGGIASPSDMNAVKSGAH